MIVTCPTYGTGSILFLPTLLTIGCCVSCENVTSFLSKLQRNSIEESGPVYSSMAYHSIKIQTIKVGVSAIIACATMFHNGDIYYVQYVYICNDIIVTNHVPVPTLSLSVINLIKITGQRITSLIITHSKYSTIYLMLVYVYM